MTADSLRNVELFGHLDDDARAALADQCETRSYRMDEIVWRAGDIGDELLVIESGELEVVGVDADGSEQVIARLGPGECVGELALLLDERRSAKVTCSVAARVVVVTKDAFREVLRDQQGLARVSEVVSRRAVALTLRRPIARRVQLVGVVAEPHVAGASLIAGAIAELGVALLQRRTVLIRHGSDDEPLEAVGARARAEHADAHLVVLDLAPGIDLARAHAVCDAVVHVVASLTATAADRRVHTVLNQHRSVAPPLARNRCDPFVLPDEATLDGLSTAEAVARVVTHPHLGARATLDRLVRKLFGVTVGVALGGGAAFGIAHVGVLQALERVGVVPDLYAGTSMGSIVAIGAASGLTGDAMAEIARRRGNVRTTVSVLDPSVDGSGILAGRRLMKIFSPMIAVDRFDELVRPCRVVATDIDTGERVEIGEGRLDAAFRASCSIPLIFTPVSLDGRTLVDGAMVDPVPAEVVRAMGADIVIGVNVVPRLQRGTTTSISRLFKRVSRLNPLAVRRGSGGMPDVVDVLMNTLQIVQHELGRFRSLASDVTIDVDLSGFTWIEFYRATEIVERGVIAGEAAAAAVTAAIAERLDGEPQTRVAASTSTASSSVTP